MSLYHPLVKLNLRLKFILFCSITLTIALGISFYIVAKQQERLIMEQIEFEARALFKHIVITRKWVSDHQGVFVEKLPWVKENQYLKDIKGVETEIIDNKGRRFVRKNPAMVTRELSEYAKEKGLFSFHITSSKLINPNNMPDEFERNAISTFERNEATEIMTVNTIDNAKYFRYISPLYIEDSCMGCHAHQGYKIGDIRGAISITIPVDKTYAYIESNKKNMLIAGLLTLTSVVLAMVFLIRNLILNPINKLRKSFDEFSGSKVISPSKLKTGDEFEELSVSFSNMAKTLAEYHESLNDRIKAATKDIEETNTKLIEMNNFLKEVSIRKSDFIARASHELRTPLTSIKGAVDYINTILGSRSSVVKLKDKEFQDILMFFDIIKKNTERLIQMVKDMLDLERIELGKSEFNMTNINFSYLIEEILAYFRFDAERRNIKLTTSLDSNLYVCADEERITQVLTNLLTNAFKFSPDDSEIKIDVRRCDGFIDTRICDNGPGIPASQHNLVFEKFFKYGNKEGTGLGLAICRSIVEAHGGIIGVESDGKHGSCFYFRLPFEKCENKDGKYEF